MKKVPRKFQKWGGGGSEAFGKNSYLSHIFFVESFPKLLLLRKKGCTQGGECHRHIELPKLTHDTRHMTHEMTPSVAVNSHVSIPEERQSLDQGSLTAHFVQPIFQIDFFRFSLLPYLHFLGSVMNQSSLALGHIKQEKVPSSTNPTNSSPLTEYLTENLKPVGWNLLVWLPLPSVTVTNKRISDRRTQGGILWSVASCDMLCSIAASLTHHESLLDALLAGQICHDALEPLHHDSESLYWGSESSEIWRPFGFFLVTLFSETSQHLRPKVVLG